MVLGAAVLPHHPADEAFRSPVTLLQNRDGSVAPRGAPIGATTFRAQKFPSARSLSIAFFRLLKLGLRQKLLEPGVLLLQLSQSSGFLGVHAAVLLPPAVVCRLRHLADTADLDDGLALGDQLFGGLELADDLLCCVPGPFHGEVPGPAWPDEDSHSPWTDCRGPRLSRPNNI